MSDAAEGKARFAVGQRVYCVADPIHGKIVAARPHGGVWIYDVKYDYPNVWLERVNARLRVMVEGFGSGGRVEGGLFVEESLAASPEEADARRNARASAPAGGTR